MPGFNQKGPMGQGAMSGRRMGKCTNFGAKVKPEQTENTSEMQSNSMFGRGLGRGMGRGMGRQHRFRNGQQ